MICKECGKENADNSTFCLKCGALLNSDYSDAGQTTVLNDEINQYAYNAPPSSQNINYSDNPYQESVYQNSNQRSVYQNSVTQAADMQQTKKKKLSTGAIIGIVVAAVVVLSLIGFGISYAVRLNNASDAIDDLEIPDTDWAEDVDDDLELNTQNEFSFGSVTNDVYSNTFAGIEFKKPNDNWEFMTKEEIYSHYSETVDNVFFDDESLETYYEDSSTSSKTYYDMFLYNTQTNENVIVMMADKNGTDMSLDEFSEQLDTYLESTYSVSFNASDDVYLNGNTYKSSFSTIEADGKNVNMHYLVTEIDDCFVSIVFNVESDATADELLNEFINQ